MVPMVVVRGASVSNIYFKVEATGFPHRLNVGGHGGEDSGTKNASQALT